MTPTAPEHSAAFRLLDPAFHTGDPHTIYRKLRKQAPICRVTDGLFALSRHADVRTVMRDAEGWSSAAGVTLPDHVGSRRDGPVGEIDSDILLIVDPPRHPHYRRFAQHRDGAATATLVGFGPRIESIVADAMAEMPAYGEVDLVATVAAPVAIRSIVAVLGLPEGDIPMFQAWTDEELAEIDRPNPQHDLRGEAWEYMSGEIDDRRRNPRRDLLSWLARGEHAGFSLPPRSATAFAIDMLIAGNETTRQAIAGGLTALAVHQDQRHRLVADPDLLPQAVEEILRWVTPTPVFTRCAKAAREVSGVRFDPGDVVILLLAAANRDERAWEDADRFDVGRVPNPMHLSFGHGPHFCLGAPLARLELRIVFAAMLNRHPDFELAGEVRRRPSTVSQGYVEVPMQLLD